MAILLDKRTIFATVFFVSFFGFALGAQAATLGKPTNNLGLVGYWNFNEGTSTIATDNSGYGNHGTTSNISHPPTATSGWSPGKLGSAITFDGSNDYVSMAKEYTDVTNTFTIAMWIKPTVTHQIDSESLSGDGGVSGQEYVVFPAHGDNDFGAGHGGIGISAGTNGVSVYVHYLNTLAPILVHQATLSGWTHIAVVVNNKEPTLYINGVNVDTGLTPTQILHPFSTQFGRDADGIGGGVYGYFAGGVDDARVYSRALGQTEVSSLYKGSEVRIGASSQVLQGSNLSRSLVAHYTFDGADFSDRIYDRTGNGRHGYLRNIATSTAKAAGVLGQAFNSTSATDDFVRINSAILSETVPDGFAVAFWLRYSSPSTGQIFFERGGSGAIQAEIDGGAQALSCFIRDTTGTFYFAPDVSAIPYANQWVHFACVFDQATNNFTFYLNGASSTSALAAGFTDFVGTDTFWDIGASGGSTGMPAGQIDDFRVYERSLSAAEIKQVYNMGVASTTNRLSPTSGSSLQNSLTGYWSFNGADITDRVWDRSGSGYHGYFEGGATTTAKVAGKLGQALIFDGINDFVRVTNFNPSTMSAPFTYSMWARSTAATADTWRPIIGDVAGSCCYFIGAKGAANNILVVDFGAGNEDVGGTYTLNDGLWHHIVVVATGSNSQTIYYDGVFLDTTSVTISPAATQIGIGATSRTEYWKGNIDDVRIHNRALSASEVKQLYNLGR